MIRFSANLGFLWPELPLLNRLDAAADAGFEAVEVHWPYDVPVEEFRSRCEARGLTFLALNTARGDVAAGEFGLAAAPGREADVARHIEEAVAYAAAASGRFIHVMAGKLAGDRDEAARTLVANVRSAADISAAAGLTVLLEPINQRDVPGYFYSTSEQAAGIIAEVDRPNVAMLFDIYHIAVSQGDVLTRLERHLDRIGHIQIAGVPGRAEPDEGEIAFNNVLRRIDALGYQGWIGCEYRPRAGTDAGLGWVAALGFAL